MRRRWARKDKILKDWDMRHNTPEGFMTVTQAAKYYNVSEISILNWLGKNKITAKKYGQKWYIPKEQNDPDLQGGH
jgi:excisionase family DNA binding protein